MPNFGLSRPLGYGPFRQAQQFAGYRRPLPRARIPNAPLGMGYLKTRATKHGIYKLHLAAKKIQRIFRGSTIRRKFPVKLFSKMRRTGRFAAPNFRLAGMYK